MAYYMPCLRYGFAQAVCKLTKSGNIKKTENRKKKTEKKGGARPSNRNQEEKKDKTNKTTQAAWNEKGM